MGPRSDTVAARRSLASRATMLPRLRIAWLIAVLGIVAAPAAPALPQSSGDETELAKKTQNPVADLISVPFQSNFNFGVGSKDATVYVLNVEPVIPLHLNADWNLITRTIVPIINQPSLFPAFGLGDINPSLFLSQVMGPWSDGTPETAQVRLR